MRVLYDLDSTLADIVTPWLNIYNHRFDDNLKVENITDWNIKNLVKPEARTEIFKILNEPDFYRNVKPISEVLRMARLDVASGNEVGILTSCNSNINMIAGKIKWLTKHAWFIPKWNWIFCSSKGWGNADLLVDDRVLNIEAFLTSNPNARGFIILQPHNREEVKRIKKDPVFNKRIDFSNKELI